MAPNSSKFTLRAKWHQVWALMHARKTSEGDDLLSGIKLSDLLALPVLKSRIELSPGCDRQSGNTPILKHRRTSM